MYCVCITRTIGIPVSRLGHARVMGQTYGLHSILANHLFFSCKDGEPRECALAAQILFRNNVNLVCSSGFSQHSPTYPTRNTNTPKVPHPLSRVGQQLGRVGEPRPTKVAGRLGLPLHVFQGPADRRGVVHRHPRQGCLAPGQGQAGTRESVGWLAVVVHFDNSTSTSWYFTFC